MIKILSSPTYTEEVLMKVWNEDNPEHEYIPRKDRSYLISYARKAPLYQIAIDEEKNGKVIGYIGLIEYDTFFVGGGIRVADEYQDNDKLRVGVKLIEARQEKINTANKPIIQEINTKTMPVEKFMQVWERYGWLRNPITSIRGIPNEVLEDYKKSNNQFLVYSPDADAFGKAWSIISPLRLIDILPLME